MGLFFSGKPKVSSYELKKVRSHLYSEGFSQRDLTEFDKLFSSALASNEGVDAKEIEAVVQWLHEHPSKTILRPEQVAQIEETMQTKL